jgi:hypothetical protein
MGVPVSWTRGTQFGCLRKLYLSRIFVKKKSLWDKSIGPTRFIVLKCVQSFDVSTVPSALIPPNRSPSQNLAAKKNCLCYTEPRMRELHP